MRIELKTQSGKKIEMLIGGSILSCKIEGKEIGGKLDKKANNLPSGYVALIGGCLPIDSDQLNIILEAMGSTKTKRHISEICPSCGSYCYGDCEA